MSTPAGSLQGMKKEIENIQASLTAAAKAAAETKAKPDRKEKTIRRPFGYSIVEKTNVGYVFTMLVLLLTMMWWMSLPLESLYGTDTQVKFIRALSGDTLLVSTPTNDVIPLRLRLIDAPELEQNYGVEAMHALEKLVVGPNKELIAFIWDRETHGYYVGDLLVRKDVRTKMVPKA